jgi:hypothetical protein
MKKCPYCAEDIQDAAVVCRHCGRDLVITNPIAASTRRVTKVRQADWISTTAKWGVGIFFLWVAWVVFGSIFR